MPKETTITTKNSNLHDAKKNKNDEFYTQLSDIEKELRHYKEHFNDKIVFCNCDDPYESNFFQYFAMNFKDLKLKKLIAMGYNTSPVAMTQLSMFDVEGIDEPKKKAYKIEIFDVIDENNDGALDMMDIKLLARKNKDAIKIRTLRGDGDFRSNESINCLLEADIVVTNPPFSLFRDYVAQLMFYDKKFLIIGNQNAITYKEIFPLIKENKMWLGTNYNISLVYKTPYPNLLEANKKFVMSKWYNPDEWYVKVPAINWYTNLEHSKRNEEIELYKRYNPEEYPKYDNYDAIEVSKVDSIPKDYDGAMGVPITFLWKYNPEQFEIIKFRKWDDDKDLVVKWKSPYFRVLIKNKKPQK